MNNPVEEEIVILFNEEHQGMLKLHVHLEWVGFSACMWGGGGRLRNGTPYLPISKRGNVLRNGKITC